jgi:CheY-like chemotaxis protein
MPARVKHLENITSFLLRNRYNACQRFLRMLHEPVQSFQALRRKVLAAPSIQQAKPLQDLRILVVEDESLVAMLIEEYLTDFGCAPTCSVSRVGKALKALKNTEVDAAVLDVNIAGESVVPIAEALEQRGVPFIFASGYGRSGVDERWAGRPVLQKPFSAKELHAALIACVTRDS